MLLLIFWVIFLAILFGLVASIFGLIASLVTQLAILLILIALGLIVLAARREDSSDPQDEPDATRKDRPP